jgi:glycine/D-amino acid oxidase-like deaminating enzyme
MTEELSDDALRQLGGQPRWGVTPADPMGTTVRRIDTGQGGNRIIVRSCAEYCPQMRSSAGKLQRSVGVMRGKFDERFPALRNVRMQYSWSGHLCLSQNGVSLAGEIDSGLFTACCQNGLGTARGTLTGIAAAELASGQRSAISDFFAAQPQPTRLPPAPLAKLGATAYLNWKEWRARHE